jgi:hypothetical protein
MKVTQGNFPGDMKLRKSATLARRLDSVIELKLMELGIN